MGKEIKIVGILYTPTRLPGQPEHKKMKFEHMLQAGAEKAAAKGEVLVNCLLFTNTGQKRCGTFSCSTFSYLNCMLITFLF